jgi:sec-independent protein translocase protein TatA
MPDVSPIQLAIVLIIALVILGPKRLPDVGKSLGRGIREFKDSVSGHDVPQPLPAEHATAEPAVTAVPLTEVLAADERPVATVAADRVVVTSTETR